MTVSAAADFVPARRFDGQAARLPAPTVVGWVEEAVDFAIDEAGRVDVALVRGTTRADSLLLPAAITWRFRPAADHDRPIASHSLVYLIVRPAQLFDGPTLGSSGGELAPVSNQAPYPTAVHRPRYPPRATGEGVVTVEVLVGIDGRVSRADIVSGAAGFNDEALLTARECVFRPALRNGKPVPAYAYLMFGFRQPVQ